jgi:hypothetical protein
VGPDLAPLLDRLAAAGTPDPPAVRRGPAPTG